MFRDFRSKSGTCLKAARMFSSEVRCNRKTQNSVKLNILQNGYHIYLISLDFAPKIQNFNFQNILTIKSNILIVSKKQNICDWDAYKQHAYKISKQYLSFGLCNGKKTGKGDDVTFWNAFFGISNCRAKKWMTFLESWEKAEQDRHM